MRGSDATGQRQSLICGEAASSAMTMTNIDDTDARPARVLFHMLVLCRRRRTDNERPHEISGVGRRRENHEAWPCRLPTAAQALPQTRAGIYCAMIGGKPIENRKSHYFMRLTVSSVKYSEGCSNQDR